MDSKINKEDTSKHEIKQLQKQLQFQHKKLNEKEQIIRDLKVEIKNLKKKQPHENHETRDVTYIRQLESKKLQLNHSLEILTNLLHNVSDAIATLDMNFNFNIINLSFMQFFSKIFIKKIYSGMNFLTVISDYSKYKQQLINACHQALLGNKTTLLIENYSKELYEANYYFEVNFNPIYNNSSKEIEIILLVKDLTQFYLRKKIRMREQSKLAHAIRLSTMEGMASALAHEINQPLTAIFLYTQSSLLLVENAKKNEINANLLSLLNKVINQAKHASAVMNRMKSFILKDIYFPENTDINALIKDTLVFLDYELTHSNLKINLSLEEELPHLNIDRIQVMQIILNLARNSIEAMQQDMLLAPELSIQTNNKEEYIEIHIRDNGPGITPEHKDKILHSYFTTKPQGTGLGLTICRNLIEAHGGKLYVNNCDVGAWFTFTLPKTS